MNCSTVRRSLLNSDNPRKPGATEAGHLATCRACVAWQQSLLRLERALPLLPTPDSPVPPALLMRLTRVTQPRVVLSRPVDRKRRVESGRQKLALAFSLAASLAVFTVGWWAWPGQLPAGKSQVVVKDAYREIVTARLSPLTGAASAGGRAG